KPLICGSDQWLLSFLNSRPEDGVLVISFARKFNSVTNSLFLILPNQPLGFLVNLRSGNALGIELRRYFPVHLVKNLVEFRLVLLAQFEELHAQALSVLFRRFRKIGRASSRERGQ